MANRYPARIALTIIAAIWGRQPILSRVESEAGGLAARPSARATGASPRGCQKSGLRPSRAGLLGDKEKAPASVGAFLYAVTMRSLNMFDEKEGKERLDETPGVRQCSIRAGVASVVCSR